MKKLVVIALISLFIFNISVGAREISKIDFIENINILFLKEDYAGLIKNAEKKSDVYRLNRKEKKEVLYLMGLSYIKIDNFREARKMFHKILAMKGDNFRQGAYIGIGDSYFYEKNFSKAISAYEQVLRIYPKSDRLSSVYYNLGAIFNAKKDFDRASYYFAKIKKQYNNSFEADRPAYLPAEKKPDYYIIQLGAFKSIGNAKKLVRRLRRKRYDSYIQKAKKDGNVLYKVRGGKFSNKYYAMRLLRRLKKSGFSAKVIVE
ncbi:MAG: tetratricopeptide repeat protein [Candidatus Omnitrophota bacterium]|nr:MAG: tetratricopeptide repeat protein [Candidatus Omnitrophota bacterium]